MQNDSNISLVFSGAYFPPLFIAKIKYFYTFSAWGNLYSKCSKMLEDARLPWLTEVAALWTLARIHGSQKLGLPQETKQGVAKPRHQTSFEQIHLGKIRIGDKQREMASSSSLVKLSPYFLSPPPPPGCFRNLLYHLFWGQPKLAHS